MITGVWGLEGFTHLSIYREYCVKKRKSENYSFHLGKRKCIRVPDHVTHDRLCGMPCSIKCFAIIKYSVICFFFRLSYHMSMAKRRPYCHAPLSPRYPNEVRNAESSPSSLRLPLTPINSSVFPSICCFHVSSKIFLPPANFKYSHLVLSTIAYKHLKIIESLRADKKGSCYHVQRK